MPRLALVRGESTLFIDPISQLRKYRIISEGRKKMNDRNYTTILLCITVAFLFADQNLLSPNLSAIAREFRFSDAERDSKLGGNISFGFFVLGAPAALLVGYLTDSCNRCQLFGWVVILGEASCLGTYWVRSYPELFACRVLTGISIGGAAPVIFSLLADYWPGSSRVQMSTLIGIAMSAGIAFGQLIAGLMGPTYGWRSPFLVVAIPCLLCGILILTTSVEPVRGGQEEEVLVMRKAREQFLIQAERWDCEGCKEDTTAISKDGDDENKESQSPKDVKSSPSSSSSSSLPVINPLLPSTQTGEDGQPQSYNSMERFQNVVHHATYKTSISHDTSKFSGVYTGSQSTIGLETESTKARKCIVANDNDVSYDEKIDWSKVYDVFLTPTVALIFIQGIPGCLPWGKNIT